MEDVADAAIQASLVAFACASEEAFDQAYRMVLGS
jgi:hypothetical protein